MQNEKEAKKLKREMNLYLAEAKINKAVSLALYYAALATPVASTVYAFTKDSFREGLETALMGPVLSAGIIICAAAIRQTNPQILREYIRTRNELNELNKQKEK